MLSAVLLKHLCKMPVVAWTLTWLYNTQLGLDEAFSLENIGIEEVTS